MEKIKLFIKNHKVIFSVVIALCIYTFILLNSMNSLKNDNKLIETQIKNTEQIYNKQIELQTERINTTLAPIKQIQKDVKITNKKVESIEALQKKLLSSLSKIDKKYDEKIKYNNSTPHDVTDSILSGNISRKLSSTSDN